MPAPAFLLSAVAVPICAGLAAIPDAFFALRSVRAAARQRLPAPDRPALHSPPLAVLREDGHSTLRPLVSEPLISPDALSGVDLYS